MILLHTFTNVYFHRIFVQVILQLYNYNTSVEIKGITYALI